MNTPIETASVKVMRSHDYCHFEVVLGSSQANTPEAVDELRKAAARLADKAVEQYKIAKLAHERTETIKQSWLLKSAEDKPEDERTPKDKAIIKYHSDAAFRARFDYDYEDDWQQDDWED
jgi:hypothetical protein